MVDAQVQGRIPASSYESKKAFISWLSLSLTMFVLGVILVATKDKLLFSIGSGLAILAVFTLPFAIVWLVVWIHRKLNS